MGNGLSPFWVRVNVGTGLDGITERHICDGSVRHEVAYCE